MRSPLAQPALTSPMGTLTPLILRGMTPAALVACIWYAHKRRAANRLSDEVPRAVEYTWFEPVNKLTEVCQNTLSWFGLSDPTSPTPIGVSDESFIALQKAFSSLVKTSPCSPPFNTESTNPHRFLAGCRRLARNFLEQLPEGTFTVSVDPGTKNSEGYSQLHCLRDYAYTVRNDELPENSIINLSDVDHYLSDDQLSKLLARGNVLVLHQFYPTFLAGSFEFSGSVEASWTVDQDSVVTFRTNPSDVYSHKIRAFPSEFQVWGQVGVWAQRLISGKVYTYPSPCPLHRFVVIRPTYSGGNPLLTTGFGYRNVIPTNTGNTFESLATEYVVYTPQSTFVHHFDNDVVSVARNLCTRSASDNTPTYRVSDCAAVLRHYNATNVAIAAGPLSTLVTHLGVTSTPIDPKELLVYYAEELPTDKRVIALEGLTSDVTNVLCRASNFFKGKSILAKSVFSLYYKPRAGKVFPRSNVLEYIPNFLQYLKDECGCDQLLELDNPAKDPADSILELSPRLIKELKIDDRPSLWRAPYPELVSSLDVFNKGEPMKVNKDPRNIINAGVSSVVRMSNWSQPLAKWLKNSEHYCFVDPASLASNISSCVNKTIVIGGGVLAADASKYDSNQSAYSRVVLSAFIENLFDNHAEPLEILAGQTAGVWRDGLHTFELGNSQASGCATTSVQNTLFNMFMHFVAIVKHLTGPNFPGSEATSELFPTVRLLMGCFAGDDSISTSVYQRELAEVADSTNVPLEMVVHEERFDFLGKWFLVKHYVDNPHKLICVPVFDRVLKSMTVGSPTFKGPTLAPVGVYVKMKARADELDTIPGIGPLFKRIRSLIYKDLSPSLKAKADSYIPNDEQYHVRGQGMSQLEWIEFSQTMGLDESELLSRLEFFNRHFKSLTDLKKLPHLLGCDVAPTNELGLRNIPSNYKEIPDRMVDDRKSVNDTRCSAFMGTIASQKLSAACMDLARSNFLDISSVIDCRAGSKHLASAFPCYVLAYEKNTTVFQTFMNVVTPNVVYLNTSHKHDDSCENKLHVYDPMWYDVAFNDTILKSENFSDVISECADRPSVIITGHPIKHLAHTGYTIKGKSVTNYYVHYLNLGNIPSEHTPAVALNPIIPPTNATVAAISSAKTKHSAVRGTKNRRPQKPKGNSL